MTNIQPQTSKPYDALDAELDALFEDTQASQWEDAAAADSVPVPVPFRIDDTRKAAWAVRKLKAARQSIAERESYMVDEIQRLTHWYEIANREDNSTAEHMEALLKSYAQSELLAAKRRSLDVPGARLSFVAQQPEIHRDDAQIMAWVVAEGQQEEYIKTKEELRWSELKKACTIVGELLIAPTGEVVPGVSVAARGDRFKVTLAGEGGA